MDQRIENAKRLLIYAGVALLCVGMTIVFFKWLFLPLLPFMLAGLLSWFIVYFADILCKKTKIQAKVWCLLLLAVLFALLVVLSILALDKMLGELYRFVGGEEDLTAKLSETLDRIFAYAGERFPKLAERIDRSAIEEKLNELFSKVAEQASLFLAKAALGLPGALLFLIVTFLAALYFSGDNRKIKRFVSSVLSAKQASFLKKVFSLFKRGLRGYLRAGGYMMLMTFFILLVGLMIIGAPFPLLLAVITAAIDFLPVLGTGVILAPMGVLALIGGDNFRGFGYLILWGVTTLLREIVEPRFIGRNLNVHPLFSLFSAYLGLKLFGVPGLVLLPVFSGVLFGIVVEYAKDT